jgi:hypothetical protein
MKRATKESWKTEQIKDAHLIQDRIIGMVVGDVIGVPVEFSRREN